MTMVREVFGDAIIILKQENQIRVVKSVIVFQGDREMNKDIIRGWVNVLALVATIAVNGLANALPLNGLTTGEISDGFDVYFVPAGYVFSIWGLIYLALAAFVIYQVFPSQRENDRLRRVGYWFAASCAANIAWLFSWHYQLFPLTLLAMLVLLACLIVVYLKLDIGRSRVSTIERWLVDFPFSLYLGWVSVATIANVTSLLDYLGWGGWGISPQVWAVIMLSVGVVLAGMMAVQRGDYIYILVFIWAYIGIAVAQSDAPLVVFASWIGAVLLGLALLMIALRMWPMPKRA
jgi:hypothetical protein